MRFYHRAFLIKLCMFFFTVVSMVWSRHCPLWFLLVLLHLVRIFILSEKEQPVNTKRTGGFVYMWHRASLSLEADLCLDAAAPLAFSIGTFGYTTPPWQPEVLQSSHMSANFRKNVGKKGICCQSLCWHTKSYLMFSIHASSFTANCLKAQKPKPNNFILFHIRAY